MIQPVGIQPKIQRKFNFLQSTEFQKQELNEQTGLPLRDYLEIEKRLWHEGATISEKIATGLVRKYGTPQEVPGLDLNRTDISQNILDYYGEGTGWDDEFAITDEGLCCISLLLFENQDSLSEQDSIRSLRSKAQNGLPVYASELVNALTQIKK